MNLENIKYIVNSGLPNWDKLLLAELARGEDAISIILAILDNERKNNKELIQDLNLLLSQADTIIEEPKLNRGNFFQKKVSDFYETGRIGHCFPKQNGNKEITT